MPELRKWVSEVMIYDRDDKLSADEASEFLASYRVGGWTVDAKGISGVGELSDALKGYVNIKQLSFCTHGFPGGVYFKSGSLSAGNLKTIQVLPTLFEGPGRLLFMGCETARTQAGKDFLIAAGRHFFDKGGVVGGSTIYNLGFSSGTRLPFFGPSSGGWAAGKLILYQLDPDGKVVGSKVA